MREVRQIPYEQAVPWFLKKHYAKRIPSISYAFGLYVGGTLEGVVSYGMPPSYTLMMICGEKNREIVIELNRLVINDDSPKNSASYLVSNSIKLLPKPKIIVSFADTERGHVGYIYQACNFLYTGLSPRQKYYKVKDGGEDNGYRRRARTPKKKIINDFGEEFVEEYFSSDKHRYIYFAGCPELRKELKYKILPYPKGETKRYDSGEKLATQSYLF